MVSLVKLPEWYFGLDCATFCRKDEPLKGDE